MGIQGAGGICNNEKGNKKDTNNTTHECDDEDKHLYHTKETIPGGGFHDCTSQIRHHRDLTNFCTVGGTLFIYG